MPLRVATRPITYGDVFIQEMYKVRIQKVCFRLGTSCDNAECPLRVGLVPMLRVGLRVGMVPFPWMTALSI